MLVHAQIDMSYFIYFINDDDKKKRIDYMNLELTNSGN